MYQGGVGVNFLFCGVVICVCISLAINPVRAGCFACGILSLMCLCFMCDLVPHPHCAIGISVEFNNVNS